MIHKQILNNRILSLVLALVMVLSMLPMSAFAADNSTALTITGGTDYTYENGVLDIKTAGTYEIMNADPTTATTDAIRVSAASGEVIITLGGVNIKPTNKSAFEITGDCETTVILADRSDNFLDNTEAYHYAALQNGEKLLVITCEGAYTDNHTCNDICGKLTATSAEWSAGIGGGYESSGSNITISGGTVTATSTKWGAGIGGGYSGEAENITISGGTVTAISAERGAGIGGGYNSTGSNITISGGAVTATAQSGAGIGGGHNSTGSNITISGGIVTATSIYGAGIGGGDGGSAKNIKIAPSAYIKIYAYNGSYNTGTALNDSPFTTETDITSLLSGNAFYCYPVFPDLIITGGKAGTDHTYENGVLDIIKAGTYEIKNADPLAVTDDIVKVSAPTGTVNITLNGVNIVTTQEMSAPAFEITGDCVTNIILADNTDSILNSFESKDEGYQKYAGLQNGEKHLSISCAHSEEAGHICDNTCGSLEAVGGYYAACIGGSFNTHGSNITIHGGNITANSEGYAGIGGSWKGNGENITITGGIVTATSIYGAGIGGGDRGNGSNITISGGTVTATSMFGAGIGGGDSGNGSNITITGGTVTATSESGAGIGGGEDGAAENIKIALSANTEITVNTGATASETEKLTYSFAEVADITSLVSPNAYFYSEAVVYNLIVITADGVTTGYTDLPDAVAAAQAAEGSTLKLMNDITLTSRQDISSGRFTLDLNSHTLLNESGTTLRINTAAELTIMDSGTGGTIRSNASLNFAVLNRGSLTVESGRIIGAYIALSSDGTSLTVNGGTFEAGETHSGCISSGTAEINGGTFKGPVWGFCDYTINGGSFTADYIGINKAGGVLTINGGTFDVRSFNILNGEISVTGGAFSINPSDYVPVGYAATYDNTIGYYTVAPCTAHSWENGVCALCGTVCEHTYGNATCEAPATCSVCRAITGDALGHKDENRDHTCDRDCGKTDIDIHAAASGKHTCDYCGNAVTTCTDLAEVVKPEALKSAADCTNPAVYYKSCTVCGANGTETFTSGEAKAHTYENGKCSVCQAVDPDYVPETDSPQTGDNSNILTWIALLFISGGAVTTLTVYGRKKRKAISSK